MLICCFPQPAPIAPAPTNSTAAKTPSTILTPSPPTPLTTSPNPLIPAHPRTTTPTSSLIINLLVASSIFSFTSSTDLSCSSAAFNPVVSTPANPSLAPSIPRFATPVESATSQYDPVDTIPHFSPGRRQRRAERTLASNIPITSFFSPPSSETR